MRKKNLCTLAAAAFALTLGLTGCSSSADDKASTPEVHAEVVRGASSMDYDALTAVTKVRDKADYVVAGKVAAWHEGPQVLESSAVLEYAVLELDSTTVIKSAREGAEPRFILVRLGAYIVDEEGNEIEPEGSKSLTKSLDDVRKALPEGTRVLALGAEVAFTDPDNPEYQPKVLRDWKPVDGTSLIATYPQGFLIETAGHGYDSGGAALSEVSGDQWPASPDYKGSTEGGTFEALLRDVQQGS